VGKNGEDRLYLRHQGKKNIRSEGNAERKLASRQFKKAYTSMKERKRSVSPLQRIIRIGKEDP